MQRSARPLWPVGALLLLGLVVVGVLWLQRADSEDDVSVSIALKRLEIVGLACERFRAARGAWPETLDDLVPGQLASLPPDPYGGALRLGPDPLGGGHVVYSLGPDGVDQGGVPRDPVSGAGDLVYPLD